MDNNRDQAPAPENPDPHSPPRRFIYRAVEPCARQPHPLRRATDTPHQFQAIPGQLCLNPLLLEFRVYLKLS